MEISRDSLAQIIIPCLVAVFSISITRYFDHEDKSGEKILERLSGIEHDLLVLKVKAGMVEAKPSPTPSLVPDKELRFAEPLLVTPDFIRRGVKRIFK